MNKLDLGAVSAYAMAVEKGYKGTEEEFAALQAESGNNAVRAEDAADRAQQILASIPLDFQEVSQGVAALTEELDNVAKETIDVIRYNLIDSNNEYGNYYVLESGELRASTSWISYLIKDNYEKFVFDCYSNDSIIFNIGFYSSVKPSQDTFISGVSANSVGVVEKLVVTKNDIPQETKSIVFCSRVASGNETSLFGDKTNLSRIDDALAKTEILNETIDSLKVETESTSRNVKTIYKNIPNTNDFTIIKNEIWFAENSYQNGVATEYSTVHRYKIENGELVFISDIDTDFGHWNTVDYCEENDCLIFSNAANLETTEGNWFCVVKNPLALGSTARIAECGIKYNVDIGFKVQAVWGDNNFGQYNIVYLTSNYSNRVVKVLLLKNENGDFNGEYIILEDKTLDLTSWASGGGDFYGDTLYIGLGIRYRLGMMSMTDYTTKEIEKHYYYPDGTEYSGSTQGVHVDSRYIWVFSNVGGSSENYLIQYYR